MTRETGVRDHEKKAWRSEAKLKSISNFIRVTCAYYQAFTLASVSGFHKRTTSTHHKKAYPLSINLKCDFKWNMTSLVSVHLTRNKDSGLGR